MANEQMRDMWTRYGGPGWTANRRLFEAVYAPFHDALIRALGPVDGATVLDVGCGTGGLSQAILDRGGTPIGIDISETMIATARELVPNGRFMVADAQTTPLGEHAPAGFDLVASSFGVMFFDDFEAAFSNLRAATKIGGRLVFLCWRSYDENPNFTMGTSLLIERMPNPAPPPLPGVPGPSALADRAFTESILAAAGWAEIAIEPFDDVCNFSVDGTDGVEERLALIQGTTAGQRAAEQLIPIVGEAGWQSLLDEVREDLRGRVVDGVLSCPGATWIVTAVRPN